MEKLKRWAIENKLYVGLYIIIAFFAYLDTIQIKTFFTINSQEAWALYYQYTLPTQIWLWLISFAVIAYVCYLFTKDKTEAGGLFISGFILIFSGLEDLLYYFFNGAGIPQCMDWMNSINSPPAQLSVMLGETCTSPFALILSTAIGIGLSYFIFQALKKVKP